MDIWDEIKKLQGYQSGYGGVDSYGVDHSGFSTRDELEYQSARLARENQLAENYSKQGIAEENYPQFGTNFWGGTPENNYGFGTSNIKQNIENVTNRLNNNTNNGQVFANSDYTVNTESLVGKPSSYFQNNNSVFANSDYTVNTESLVGKPSSYFQNNNSTGGWGNNNTSGWNNNTVGFGGNTSNGFNQNANFGTNPSYGTTPVLQNQTPTPWNNPATQVTTVPKYDNYLNATQRIRALRNGENLRLHIDENPQENGDWKRWCDLDQGSIAVNKYNDIVDKYANQYNIDPDLVKAIMFAENACGYYYGANKLADYLGFSKSQLPMNIRGNIWSDFQGKHYDTNVPEQNIELGTRLIKQIYDSIEYPTPEKVTTIWNSAAKDKISSFGYRGGTAYRTKPWLNNKGK